MKTLPCAKINLGLNVIRRRPDGYHDLETVFYPVGIHDELIIEQSPCAALGEPLTDESNLVMKAYRLLQKEFSLPSVAMYLTKNIPMQAGMGGGSADCAYTMRMLNEMFSLGLSDDELRQRAARLGADCAFFIDPRPSYAESIGEDLTPISVDLSPYSMVIVKPSVSVSTKEAFAGITPRKPEKNCLDIVMQPVETWRKELHNDFEDSIFPQLPILAEIKQKLYDAGALYASMSGSGSAMFALFREVPSALSESFPDCFYKQL